MEAEHVRAIITEQFLSERETFDKKFSEQMRPENIALHLHSIFKNLKSVTHD